MSKVTAIVVTYNGMKWYDRCFGSLVKQSLPVDIVAVDNASSDGSADYIRDHFPQIHLIESGENLGFAKANNIGIKYALDNGADYVLLLNHDAWFEAEDGVETLIKQSEVNPKFWIMSPLQIYAGSKRIEDEVKYHFARNKDASNDFISDAFNGTVKDVYSVEYACAFCWLLPISTVKKIGGFDPLFYHYGEDDNYQQRVRYFGGSVGICPKVRVCHDIEGRSEEFRAENLDWKKYLLIENCDINKQTSVIQIKKTLRKRIVILVFRISLKRLKAELKNLKFWQDYGSAIAHSRQVNMVAGSNWL